MPLVKAKIRAGYSPEPDQAFVFYAIAAEKMKTEGITFSHAVEDAEHLDRRALKAELEVSAISALTFLRVADRYAVIPCGTRVGVNEGLVIVSRESIYPKDLAGKQIAVPGFGTTAYAALKLFLPDCRPVPMHPKEMFGAVREGKIDAAVLAGETEFRYEDAGFKKVASLGEWFYEQTRLPLPLVLLAIKKNLGRDVMRKVTRLLRDSTKYALKHRADVLEYTRRFISREAGAVEDHVTERILERAVGEGDLAVSRKIKEGLWMFQKLAAGAGFVKNPKKIEFVDM